MENRPLLYLRQINNKIKDLRQTNKKQSDNDRHRTSEGINNKSDPKTIIKLVIDNQHNIIIDCNDTELKELLQQTITEYYNKKDLSI